MSGQATEGGSSPQQQQVGLVVTGLLGAMAVATFVWAQQGPGFEWDPKAAAWIKASVPGLKALSLGVSWPVVRSWPFAGMVMATVLGLCASRHPRAAVELLGAVCGGMLMYSLLSALPVELGPSRETLYYGTFLGGLSLALQKDLKPSASALLWGLAGALAVLPGLAMVSTGDLPSAWMVSMLLVATWLAALHQMME